MPNVMDERDNIQFREPILAQKDVKVAVSFAEPSEWKPKAEVHAKEEGISESYKACKITLTITDDSVKTESADAKPRMVIEDQFNVQRYPYLSKAGKVEWLNRGKLFDIEAALGFEPRFVGKDGQVLEPFITRTGNKVAPKVDGVSRVINPDFFNAYFHEDGTVNPTNWIGKKLIVDVGVEQSEQYGTKNIVARYKKPATI